jgi:hypothetical protein
MVVKLPSTSPTSVPTNSLTKGSLSRGSFIFLYLKQVRSWRVEKTNGTPAFAGVTVFFVVTVSFSVIPAKAGIQFSYFFCSRKLTLEVEVA